ncbi:MAG: hypothetical protein Q4Q17_04115 [Tissierellia bacterium]|nr:hypothetical protein [Tissierellia bacterium]
MFTLKKNTVATLLVAIIVLGVLIPTVDAMGFMPRTDYQSADYSIPMGGGTWDGEDEGYLWDLTAESTILSVSIKSSSTKTVTATLYRNITLLPDKKVISVSLTGSNGDWNSSPQFVPKFPDQKHYARVESNDSYGVVGRVSVQ